MFDFGNANINQKEAITHTEGPLLIIAGPGTGKTTIIKCIIDIFEKCGMKVLLGAPTGRAAKSTGRKCVCSDTIGRRGT